MKRILGIDLGTNSIGWALVNEAENENEKSSIVKLGVRVNPLTVDESSDFEKGKSITTNATRTLKRHMRRNLQRFKLRRENLISVLKENGFISDDTILSEQGNYSTFETYRLRAKAVSEKISLDELSRVLLMINKKRGYKSSRKIKVKGEGSLINSMDVAKKLYDEDLTPGQFMLQLLTEGKKYTPDFYRSDLRAEFDKIWQYQYSFYPDILTEEFYQQIQNKSKQHTSKIFLGKYGIYTAENKGADKKIQAYKWRVEGLSEQLTKEELAFVISDLNGSITNSSGYLGSISDRSKKLYFNKQTVGQFLIDQLEHNPNVSLKNQVFYRQDYMDEFDAIWETQAQYHPELTKELKHEIRDIIIFYQQRLKSQKGLINYCEFEKKCIEVTVDGKRKKKITGLKVCPKSSPLFQEFKIWQKLNDLLVINKDENKAEPLSQEAKELLFNELSIKETLTKDGILKLLFNNYKELDLNIKEIEGNLTQAALYKAYSQIILQSGHDEYDFSKLPAARSKEIVSEIFHTLGINTDILDFDSSLLGDNFDKQPHYQLWHLLYSYEGDNSVTGNEKLINKLSERYGFKEEYATILANVTFKDDYGSLSAKAMRKVLPFMKEGNNYSQACECAGYRHSKSSLTRYEIDNKPLIERLELLPKNSLRNPVVEKILNQMINLINALEEKYERPDEIHVELARMLKNNAKERERLTQNINKATAEHKAIRELLKSDKFGLAHVSRNDIIRYKLYEELKDNGYRTLYSNTYISPTSLFSKDIDIEHIIPKAKLFDDSFSNKTLELRSVNDEKGDKTAYDFVLDKYGEQGLADYLARVDNLFKGDPQKESKLKNLKKQGSDITGGFIERDLRETQYIARKAKEILESYVKNVVTTTGRITDRLREDWQLVDVMRELNWAKYEKAGLTEIIEGRDGQKIYRIKDWTKRNDHRHHAMDALTVAFTRHNHIKYLNNLNAKSDKNSDIYAIEKDELVRNNRRKQVFKPPIPLKEFRAEAKKHLEEILISIKAKNKILTSNVNITKKKGGSNKKIQKTPRGQLHLETIYGSCKQPVVRMEKVGSAFNEDKIQQVCKKEYRDALLKRLKEHDGDPKKAFAGKNSLSKKPIFIDDNQSIAIPERVKTVSYETIYTIRKDISPDLKVEKVIDKRIRTILEDRLAEFDGDAKKAFSNLEENPIWVNEEKGIELKRVTISGISNGIALHDKKDKDGKFILDENGQKQPVDYVNTGNNHHVAVYRDEKGKLQENVISFFEATVRCNSGLSVVDKEYRKSEGWEFLFSMKQNEYFVFPNDKTGFYPTEVNLRDPDNYALISPNLYRVQKIATKDYFFRHHLETNVENNNLLKDITWIRCGLGGLDGIVKVRINHIGEIVSVGEY